MQAYREAGPVAAGRRRPEVVLDEAQFLMGGLAHGQVEVGRVLPADYLWFSGDSKRNHFRNAYKGGTVWDWSLPSPYED